MAQFVAKKICRIMIRQIFLLVYLFLFFKWLISFEISSTGTDTQERPKANKYKFTGNWINPNTAAKGGTNVIKAIRNKEIKAAPLR